jgi:TatD DNase family protein
MWIDSHCHLTSDSLKLQLPDVVSRMVTAHVESALVVSTTRDDWSEVVYVRDSFKNFDFRVSLGLHPEEVLEQEPSIDELVDQARQLKVCAIGETGLDYFHPHVPRDIQKERFRTHIRAARKLGLPLIIHTREAAEDTLSILREEKACEVGGVMHCFTESLDVAIAAMRLNFKISFSGILTFKNAQNLRDTAGKIPLEWLLIETDAPYLAPVPYRGKTNEPAYVPHVGECLAAILKVSPPELAQRVCENYYQLFSNVAI